MPLTIAISDALHAQADIDAMAVVDLRSGAILAAAARAEAAQDDVEIAAVAAAQLCAAPRLVGGDDPVPAREALAVSERAIHAFARSSDAHRAVVAIARAGANVALVLASVRAVAASMPGAR